MHRVQELVLSESGHTCNPNHTALCNGQNACNIPTHFHSNDQLWYRLTLPLAAEQPQLAPKEPPIVVVQNHICSSPILHMPWCGGHSRSSILHNRQCTGLPQHKEAPRDGSHLPQVCWQETLKRWELSQPWLDHTSEECHCNGNCCQSG